MTAGARGLWVAAVGIVAATVCAAPAAAETVRYGFTGSEQTFVVPAGVHALNLVAIGGRGGTGQGGAAGGLGAVATGDVPITPGAVLYIEVGGNGAGATPAGPGPAGFNGGGGGGSNPLGRHGGAGGDASDVRTVARSVPGSVASRVVTAGGGGGGGAAWGTLAGGTGGDAAAQGGAGAGGASSCFGGQPGTATAGGAGGGTGAGAGDAGVGGSGANQPSVSGAAGGGGGAGYYGGGGGAPGFQGMPFACAGAGGGGGSSGFSPLATGTSVALDQSGAGPSVTITYSLPTQPPGPPPPPGGGDDRTRPTLRSLAMSPSRFIAANSGPSLRPAARVGTTVSYRLSEPASTRFTVERAARGARRGRRCVRRGRAPKRARRCTRYVTLRPTLTHSGSVGPNGFRFMGRMRGRRLRPGAYRLVARATDTSGNRSKPARKRFRIVRGT